MDMNGRSMWHEGGTRAPSLVKRGGQPYRIRRGVQPAACHSVPQGGSHA